MKKVNNKLAMALLRGTIALSGIMTTITIALFTESLTSCVTALLVGALIISLIDESINK